MSEDTTTLATPQPNVADAVTGKVTAVKLYGALVDIGAEKEAFLHISQLGKADVYNMADALSVGDEVSAYILKFDSESGRAVLTSEKPPELSWETIEAGSAFHGTVLRIEKYGAFIDIGAEKPGMVHVSEMSDGFVQSPDDVLSVGQEVDVRVLRVSRKKRQIDLTMKQEAEIVEEEIEEVEEIPTAMELAFKRAQSNSNADGKNSKKDRRTEADRKRQQDQREELYARTLKTRD